MYYPSNYLRRVWRCQSGNQNRRKTDNTMAKRKRTKGQTVIYKTLHIKLFKIVVKVTSSWYYPFNYKRVCMWTVSVYCNFLSVKCIFFLFNRCQLGSANFQIVIQHVILKSFRCLSFCLWMFVLLRNNHFQFNNVTELGKGQTTCRQ